jgi:Flp pilus assembly protein TadD
MPRSRKRKPGNGATPPVSSLQQILKAFEQRDFATVVEQCRRMSAREPRNVDVLNLLGGAYIEQGETAAAIDVLTRAVSLKPGDAMIESNLGSVLATAKRFGDAENHLNSALAQAPDDIDILANLARVQFELGQFDKASATFASALALAPNHIGILTDAIRAAVLGGDTATAKRYAAHAVALDVHDAAAQRQLTRVLYEHNLYTESLAAAGNALTHNEAHGGLHIDKGVVLSRLERHDEALASFEEALRHDPDNADATMWNSVLNLSLGRFSAGWPAYRARQSMRSAVAPNSLAASGRGYHDTLLPADLSGATILVDRDQGLGDELFFLRFLKTLKDRGAIVTYRPDDRLGAMLRRSDIADTVTADPGPSGSYDYFISVCDLPWLTGAGREESTLPSIALSPFPDRTAKLSARLAAFGDGPYVGVTWRAGTVGNNRFLHKEVPAERLARAVAGTDGTIVVLQRNPADGEVEAFSRTVGRKVLDLSNLNADLEEMLGLCALLDVYVGVSNTNIHLRESCGLPSHVMVPYPPEFRWMAAGHESPWFPVSNLYRQSPDADWEAAMSRLADAFGTTETHFRVAV